MSFDKCLRPTRDLEGSNRNLKATGLDLVFVDIFSNAAPIPLYEHGALINDPIPNIFINLTENPRAAQRCTVPH